MNAEGHSNQLLELTMRLTISSKCVLVASHPLKFRRVEEKRVADEIIRLRFIGIMIFSKERKEGEKLTTSGSCEKNGSHGPG